MSKLILQARTRALVIVAHPDDETIWFGGHMLANPKVNWTIFCLSRADDKDRAPKFARVIKAYKANGIIENWDDEGNLNFNASIQVAKKILTTNLTGEHFDYVFTHGLNGEYGHEMHKACYQAVKELIRAGKISTVNALCFNYKKISAHKLKAKADSDFTLRLSAELLAKKKKIMSSLYGFDPKGIDASYCTNPEALKYFKKTN